MSLILLIGFMTTCVIADYQTTGSNSSVASSRQSQSCSNGYYWSGQACLGCKTVAQGYCKCNQYNGCDQVTCNTGYSNIGNTSYPLCIKTCDLSCTNCVVQNNAQVCTACVAGYQLVGGICLQLSNCQTISEQTGICNRCVDGMYFDWQLTNATDKVCQNCMGGCKTCGSSTTCSQCQQGYYWNIDSNVGQCSSCSTSCLVCTNSSFCVTCNVATYLNTANNQCAACPSNCVQCLNGTTCTQCQSQYVLTSGTCNACSVNCLSCSSSTQCTACASNYKLGSDGSCYPCPSNCQTCTINGTTTGCSACIDTYYLSSPNVCQSCQSQTTTWLRCSGPNDSPALTPVQPTQCTNGYWLVSVTANNVTVQQCNAFSASNLCMAVLSNSSSDCSQCFPGYQLVQRKCYTCSINCQQCESTIPLTVNTSLPCQTCKVGYYLGTDKQCAQCPTGCSSCTDANTCSACQSGFYFNANSCSQCQMSACSKCDNTGKCSACMDGYFLQSTTSNNVTTQYCALCSSDCATCTSANGCATCKAGTQMKNGACVQGKDSGCVLTDPKTSQCALCNYGYYLKSGSCLACLDKTAGFICRTNLGVTPNSTVGSTSTFNYLLTLSLTLLLALL